MYLQRVLGLFLCVMLFAMIIGTPVFAATVYQGRDMAQTRDYNRQVRVCDRERDGNGAYTQFVVRGGATGWRYDRNGSRYGCTWTGRFYNGIYSHRVCERINNWPNRCSSYVYP